MQVKWLLCSSRSPKDAAANNTARLRSDPVTQKREDVRIVVSESELAELKQKIFLLKVKWFSKSANNSWTLVRVAYNSRRFSWIRSSINNSSSHQHLLGAPNWIIIDSSGNWTVAASQVSFVFYWIVNFNCFRCWLLLSHSWKLFRPSMWSIICGKWRARSLVAEFSSKTHKVQVRRGSAIQVFSYREVHRVFSRDN